MKCNHSHVCSVLAEWIMCEVLNAEGKKYLPKPSLSREAAKERARS